MATDNRDTGTCWQFMLAALSWTLLFPSGALAQTDPASPRAKTANKSRKIAPGTTTTDIVVTGQSRAEQSTIDRKTYKISNDLQSGAGSASDILRDVPSVDIDAQGAVSLRGDPNVQILINGKSSTTMSNANRADALEQFPANTIDHVEVITNPSAQFKPDGSGGIINIVTKKNEKRGFSGSINASGGTDGRFNLSGQATYRKGPVTATAGLTLHRDMRRRPFTDRRTSLDAATLVAATSSQDSLFHGEKLSRIATGSIDYDVGENDHVSANGSYTLRTGTPQTQQHNLIFDPISSAVSDFNRSGSGHEHEVSDEASAQYRHNFKEKGKVFTLDLRREETIENEVRRFTDLYRLPVALMTIDQQHPRLDTLQRELKTEYTEKIFGGKLLLGYDLEHDANDFRNSGDVIDPGSGLATIDPSHTNHFAYWQTIHAGYVTFDTPLLKAVSAIFGLRVEQTNTKAHQFDLNITNYQSYFRAYPTLHLEYGLADGQSLKFSFSKRVVRPDPEDFNPTPEFSDPLSQRVGNPNLKPEETQSFEAAYQYERHGLSAEATLFLRKKTNAFTNVSRFITPTTLLTTKENIGRSTAFGIDFAAHGRIVKSVNYRISGTLSSNQIDASNLGIIGKRSLVGLSAKAGIDYALALRDLVQFSTSLNGKRLTPQGYRLASFTANVGYRHKFNSGLSTVLSVSDIFNSQLERSVIDTPLLIDRMTRRNTGRILSIAVTLPFGGGKTSPVAPIEAAE